MNGMNGYDPLQVDAEPSASAWGGYFHLDIPLVEYYINDKPTQRKDG